ncbi:hypothetical protein MTO96_042504 [Rhipicephalus appendiculatus]
MYKTVQFAIIGALMYSTALLEVAGEDICASVEGFCNTSECLPDVNAKSFTCKCDSGQYFNATARRCYHLYSCLHNQCHHSMCEDGDGYYEAKCTFGNGSDPQMNEFEYNVKFQVHPEGPEQEATLAHCNNTTWLANVHEAMKNFYGKPLMKSTVRECGERVTVKLTFSEEPNRYVLRRIHLCEIRVASTGCSFPPTLSIVRGSVSGPDPVDVCIEYFRDVDKNTNASCQCTAEGNGRYTLLCAGGNVAYKIDKAALEVQHYQGTEHPDESGASTWYAAIGLMSVAVIAIALFSLCNFEQHI